MLKAKPWRQSWTSCRLTSVAQAKRGAFARPPRTPPPRSCLAQTAPHKAYTAFRYAPPYAEDALRQMAADGVRRAVAFSQYPHFSCTTSGSSYNNLWREVMRLGMEKDITWSLIDRWPTFPTYIRALTQRVEEGLATVPAEQRHSTVIIFTAHSVPMKVVNRGDQYVAEVASTVSAVMSQLWQQQASPPAQRNPYVLAWQSKVGFLPWMGPSTSDVIKGLARQGHTSVLMVPVAFTSDHIETLFEIDIEYAEEAEEAGITTFARAPSLNDSDTLTTAQAELVAEHLAAGQLCTTQYTLNCAGCVNPACRTILNPAGGPGSYSKLRDSYGTPGQVPTWPSEAEKAAIQSTVGRTP